MLRYQVGLIALLIACVAFISCDELVELLTPPAPEEDMPDDMMDTMMGLPMYISMYASWLSKSYPEAVGPGEKHGLGARTVYINDVGAMALEDENLTAYPAGTIIVKEIMDDANTFIQKVATMKKTDDPMYTNHNGWTYKKYARADENTEYMQVGGDGLPDAAEGCHACHAAAPVDSVFVDFSMDDATTDDSMTTDDGITTDDSAMPDDGMMAEDDTMADYTSWLSATLPTAIGSGAAHTQNPRTIYINDVGVMALQAGETTFPAGTIVYKDIMDATNTSVAIVEKMEKSDDPMYADTNGWLYNDKGSQAGCHGCHSTAGVDPIPGMDSVFTVQALMASLAAAAGGSQ